MRRALLAIILSAALLGVTNPTAAHATLHNGFRYIDGKCGLHKGQRVIPTLHRYHVRIHACAGWEHILLCSPADWPCGAVPIDNRRSDWWKEYNPWRWNWYGVMDLAVDSTVTYAACNTFSLGLLGELPSGGSDTAITAAALYGCIKGAFIIADDMDQNFGTRR